MRFWIILALVTSCLGQGGAESESGGPGGDELYINDYYNVYGNDVIERDDWYMSKDAKKTFIDSTYLSEGRLRKIYAYVHATGKPTTVRFQIWRAGYMMDNSYTLVWETRVNFGGDQAQGPLFSYDVPYDEAPYVENGDAIGWTNEQEISPISYNILEIADYNRGYYRKVLDDVYPDVYSTYEFTWPLEKTFSIAYQIETEMSASSDPVHGGAISWMCLLLVATLRYLW